MTLIDNQGPASFHNKCFARPAGFQNEDSLNVVSGPGILLAIVEKEEAIASHVAAENSDTDVNVTTGGVRDGRHCPIVFVSIRTLQLLFAIKERHT